MTLISTMSGCKFLTRTVNSTPITLKTNNRKHHGFEEISKDAVCADVTLRIQQFMT